MAGRPSSPSPAPSSIPALLPQGPHTGKPPMPMGRIFTMVGSRHRAHLHLLSRSVSKAHAVVINDRGNIYIRDTASREHLYVNGQPVKEVDLRNGDMIKIGSFVFQLLDKSRMSGRGSPRRATEAAVEVESGTLPTLFDGRTLVIGRRPTCDVVLTSAAVSNVHAVIFEYDGQHYVRDLGSRTGTYVNGEQIHQELLKFGDQLRIGDHELKFVPATADEAIDELEHLIGTATLGAESAELAYQDAARVGDAELASLQSPAPADEGQDLDVIPLAEPDEDSPLMPQVPAVAARSVGPAAPIKSAPAMPSPPAPIEDLAELDLNADPDIAGPGDTQPLALESDETTAPPVISAQVVDDAEEIGVESEERQLLVGGDLQESKADATGSFANIAWEEEETAPPPADFEDFGLELIPEETVVPVEVAAAPAIPPSVPVVEELAPLPLVPNTSADTALAAAPAPVSQATFDDQLALAEAIAAEYGHDTAPVPSHEHPDVITALIEPLEITPESDVDPTAAAEREALIGESVATTHSGVASLSAVEPDVSEEQATLPTPTEVSATYIPAPHGYEGPQFDEYSFATNAPAHDPMHAAIVLDLPMSGPVPPPFPAGMHPTVADGALGLPRLVDNRQLVSEEISLSSAPGPELYREPVEAPETSSAPAEWREVMEPTDPTPESAQHLAAHVDEPPLDGHDPHAESTLAVDALSDSHFGLAMQDFAGSALGSLIEHHDIFAAEDASPAQTSSSAPAPSEELTLSAPVDPIESAKPESVETDSLVQEAAPEPTPSDLTAIAPHLAMVSEPEPIDLVEDTAGDSSTADSVVDLTSDASVAAPETPEVHPLSPAVAFDVVASTEFEEAPATHEAGAGTIAESKIEGAAAPEAGESGSAEVLFDFPVAAIDATGVSEPEQVATPHEASADPSAAESMIDWTDGAIHGAPQTPEALFDSLAAAPDAAAVSEAEQVAAPNESDAIPVAAESSIDWTDAADDAVPETTESLFDSSPMPSDSTAICEPDQVVAAPEMDADRIAPPLTLDSGGPAESSAPEPMEMLFDSPAIATDVMAGPEIGSMEVLAELPSASPDATDVTSANAEIAHSENEGPNPWMIGHAAILPPHESTPETESAAGTLTSFEDILSNEGLPGPTGDEIVDQALAFLEHAGEPAEQELGLDFALDESPVPMSIAPSEGEPAEAPPEESTATAEPTIETPTVPVEEWPAEDSGEPAFQGVPHGFPADTAIAPAIGAEDDYGLEFEEPTLEEAFTPISIPSAEAPSEMLPGERSEASVTGAVESDVVADLFAPEDAEAQPALDELRAPHQPQPDAPAIEIGATAADGLMSAAAPVAEEIAPTQPPSIEEIEPADAVSGDVVPLLDEFEASASSEPESAPDLLDLEEFEIAPEQAPEEIAWPAAEESGLAELEPAAPLLPEAHGAVDAEPEPILAESAETIEPTAIADEIGNEELLEIEPDAWVAPEPASNESTEDLLLATEPVRADGQSVADADPLDDGLALESNQDSTEAAPAAEPAPRIDDYSEFEAHFIAQPAPAPPPVAPRGNPMLGMSRDIGSFLGGVPLALPTAPVRRVARAPLFGETPVSAMLKQNPEAAPLLGTASGVRLDSPPTSARVQSPLPLPPVRRGTTETTPPAAVSAPVAPALEVSSAPVSAVPPVAEAEVPAEVAQTWDTQTWDTSNEPTAPPVANALADSASDEFALEESTIGEAFSEIDDESAETAGIPEAPIAELTQDVEAQEIAAGEALEHLADDAAAPDELLAAEHGTIDEVSESPAPAESQHDPAAKLFDSAPESLDSLTHPLDEISDITEAVGEQPVQPRQARAPGMESSPPELPAPGSSVQAPRKNGGNEAGAGPTPDAAKSRRPLPPPPARSVSRRSANGAAPPTALAHTRAPEDAQIDVFSQLPVDEDPAFGAPEIPSGGYVPPAGAGRRTRPPGGRPPNALSHPPGQRKPGEPVPAIRKPSRKPAIVESLNESESDISEPMDAASPLEGESPDSNDSANRGKKTKKRWRFPFFGLSLLLVAAGGAAAGAWFALPPKSDVRATLRFDGLNHLSDANRQAFVRAQQNILAADDFRNRSQQLYTSDNGGHSADGFLDRSADANITFATIAESARAEGDRLVLNLQKSRDPQGDRIRLRAVLGALYQVDRDANDASISRKAQLKKDEAQFAHLKQSVDEMQERQAAFTIASKTKNELSEQSGEEQKALAQASAAVQTLRTELDAMKTAANPLGEDAPLKEMTAHLKQLNDELSAARAAQNGGASNAEAVLDSALAQFQAEIDADKAASNDGSALAGYLAAARQAQTAIRQARAELAIRQNLSHQTVADLTRTLAEKKTAIVEKDAEFAKLTEGFQALDHLLNAGRSFPSNPAELSRINTQWEESKKSVEARRRVIASGPAYKREIDPIQKLIDDQIERTRGEQTAAEQRIDEQFKMLAAAAPKADALSPEQRQMLARLDEKLAAVKTSHEQASRIALAGNAADFKALETQAAELEAQAEARRRELTAAASAASHNPPPDAAAIAKKTADLAAAEKTRTEAMGKLQEKNDKLAAAQAALSQLHPEQPNLVGDNTEMNRLQSEIDALKGAGQRDALSAAQPQNVSGDDSVQIVGRRDYRPAALTALGVLFAAAAGLLVFRGRRTVDEPPSRARRDRHRATGPARGRPRPVAAA